MGVFYLQRSCPTCHERVGGKETLGGARNLPALFLHWLANFAVSQVFPVFLAAIGPGITFLGYAVIGVLAFVFVSTLVIVSTLVTETNGRSLEEIEADLQEKATLAAVSLQLLT